MTVQVLYGLTLYDDQEVYILKNQKNEIKTLKHELTHVWLYEYGYTCDTDRTYSIESVCEIVSSSNKFINGVVLEYISKMEQEELQGI